jgi:lambda family phage tail tape measure protein
MGMLARLGVVLGLDSGEFKQGLESADRSLSNFSSKVATVGTVSAAAFAAMTYKALAYSDAMADVAKANDIAIKTVMALSEGLAQNGGSADNAGKLILSFTTQVDSAAQGSKEAQEAFKRLNVSLKDLANKDVTELFDQTVKALADMEDPLSRAALGITMFGKAGKGVDFIGLAEGTAQARQEFEQYADAVKIAADLNDKLDAKVTKTIVLFNTAFLPSLNALFDALVRDAKGMDALMEAASTAGKFIAEIFYNVYTVVMMMGAAVTFVASAIKNLFTGQGFDAIKKDFEVLNDRIKELWNNAKAFHNEMKKPETKEAAEIKQTITGPKRTVIPYVDKAEQERLKRMAEAIEMAKKLSVEYERQSQFDLDQIKRKAELNGLTDKERKIAESTMQMREQLEQKLEAIESKRQDAIIKKETELANEFQKQKDIIASRSDFFIAETERVTRAIQEEQNTFEFGWNKAFAQYIEDSENAAKRGQEVFETVTGNMNSAIENFVRTGKLSFSSLAKSIIQDLIAIQLKASATAMFKSGFSMFANGGTDVGGYTSSMAQFADGGNPPVGVASIVGERGPELFIPHTAGTIIPNNRMQSALGGGQTVNNFTINAIDTKSFEDRLYNSSNAVWAANQYANKTLAIGRGRS